MMELDDPRKLVFRKFGISQILAGCSIILFETLLVGIQANQMYVADSESPDTDSYYNVISYGTGFWSPIFGIVAGIVAICISRIGVNQARLNVHLGMAVVGSITSFLGCIFNILILFPLQNRDGGLLSLGVVSLILTSILFSLLLSSSIYCSKSLSCCCAEAKETEETDIYRRFSSEDERNTLTHSSNAHSSKTVQQPPYNARETAQTTKLQPQPTFSYQSCPQNINEPPPEYSPPVKY